MSRSTKAAQTVRDEDTERERLAELDRLAELACLDDPPLTEEQRLILGPILRRWAQQAQTTAPDEAA